MRTTSMSLSKASASATVEETDIVNYISVCGICLSTYEVPKALIPCLHSFCLECIREWARALHGKRDNPKGGVTCPNCRKECILPGNGVDGLPTNFFIMERNQKEVIPDCSSCSNHNRDVVARCCECGFICKECLLPHKSMRALKEHDVIMLDKLRAGKIARDAGILKISKRLGDGAFALEKTIDLEQTDSSCTAYCCAILSASKYQVTVPAFTSSNMHVFGIDGTHQLKIDTQVGLEPGRKSSPYHACANSDGVIYITQNSPWMKVHDAKGRFMHLFQLVDGNGTPCESGYACGIVIDDKQQIIVGDTKNDIISIFGPDESFITSFKVDIQPDFLTTTSRDTLLVCSTGSDNFLEVDYSGKVLRTITTPIKGMAWTPRGICCSKEDEIFVANAGSDKCGIYRFTMAWKYTGCVTSELSNPYGIAISDDDEILAVIDSRSKLKIFRRK